MVKSLTVSIEAVEKGEHVSITGIQNPTEFVKDVVLTIGTFKITLNSQDLAEALAAVVDFQTPPKSIILVPAGSDVQNYEPMPTGISNLGWTKQVEELIERRLNEGLYHGKYTVEHIKYLLELVKKLKEELK